MSNFSHYNKILYGNVPLHTQLYYDSWVKYLGFILIARRAHNIVNGKDPKPQALDIDQADLKTQEVQGATSILLSCSLDIRSYFKGI
jgi:hypothetical protein